MSQAHADNHPAERYAELPEKTREWLENLRPEDITEITVMRDTFNKARIIAKFGRWLFLTVIAAIIMGATFGESVAKLLRLFHGGKP